MINITDKAKCTGCTACYNICNHKAISMQFDEYGQIYPVVNQELCVDCGLCEKVCPLLHLERIPKDSDIEKLKVKAIYNKDEEVRRRSTSGGVFSLLAEYVISMGGVVCAARFDENYHIRHSFFEKMEDIDPYRGSKYAQSDIGDVFSHIKSYLKQRPVLFVGTPCQVAGLKSFLQKDYNNLYTCDFICMSISSGRMWDEYILDYQHTHKIRRLFFKDKQIGWHKTDWRMLIEDEEGEHRAIGMKNPFLFSYLTHYSARPSCFSCALRHCKHIADVTIADAWGIEICYPKFDDNRGCTTLIIQSVKGHEIFEGIKNKVHYLDWNIDAIRQNNKHIENQAYKPTDYDTFNELYKINGFLFTSKYFMSKNRKPILIQIKNKIKKLFQ